MNAFDTGKKKCLELGCCFGAPKLSGGPWCFHPKAESDSSSEVPFAPPAKLGVASAPEGPASAPKGPGAVPDDIVQKRKLTKAIKRIQELERITQAWEDCMKDTPTFPEFTSCVEVAKEDGE